MANPRMFGFVARGADTDQSDLDLLGDSNGHMSLLDVAGL
jgi:predicted nucleotidyltransferase